MGDGRTLHVYDAGGDVARGDSTRPTSPHRSCSCTVAGTALFRARTVNGSPATAWRRNCACSLTTGTSRSSTTVPTRWTGWRCRPGGTDLRAPADQLADVGPPQRRPAAGPADRCRPPSRWSRRNARIVLAARSALAQRDREMAAGDDLTARSQVARPDPGRGAVSIGAPRPARMAGPLLSPSRSGRRERGPGLRRSAPLASYYQFGGRKTDEIDVIMTRSRDKSITNRPAAAAIPAGGAPARSPSLPTGTSLRCRRRDESRTHRAVELRGRADAAVRPPSPRLVTDLTAERDRINRTITGLVRSRDVLNKVIGTASGQPGPDIPGS